MESNKFLYLQLEALSFFFAEIRPKSSLRDDDCSVYTFPMTSIAAWCESITRAWRRRRTSWRVRNSHKSSWRSHRNNIKLRRRLGRLEITSRVEPKKTFSDIFTDIECYRRSGAVVLMIEKFSSQLIYVMDTWWMAPSELSSSSRSRLQSWADAKSRDGDEKHFTRNWWPSCRRFIKMLRIVGWQAKRGKLKPLKRR